MSEVTDLVVIENANAMTVFQSADQIEEMLQKFEREVMSFVPDITTATVSYTHLSRALQSSSGSKQDAVPMYCQISSSVTPFIRHSLMQMCIRDSGHIACCPDQRRRMSLGRKQEEG